MMSVLQWIGDNPGMVFMLSVVFLVALYILRHPD